MTKVIIADISLFLVAVVWGAGIPVSAMLARTITPLWAVALRMLASALCLMIVFPQKIVRAKKIDWSYSFIEALICTVVFTCMTFGLTYSTASKQSFISGLYVIFVPIFVWVVFRTAPSRWLFAGAFVTTAGLCVIGFTPEMAFNFGDMLSVFMAACLAIQIIYTEWCVKRMDPTSLVVLHIILLSAILAVIALIFEPVPDFASFDMKIWGGIVFMSVFSTVICFIVQFYAQRYTSAAHTAIICSLEGLFGCIVAIASGQDQFHLQGAVGGAMMIAGTMLAEAEVFIAGNKTKAA